MITIYLTNSPVITIYWTNDYTLLSNDNDIAIEQNKNTLLIYVEFIFVFQLFYDSWASSFIQFVSNKVPASTLLGLVHLV